MTDIDQRCVHCGEDTSFGSKRFVNRISADADYGVSDAAGNCIFAEDEYRNGYACAECGGFECDRCGKQIYLDECNVLSFGWKYLRFKNLDFKRNLNQTFKNLNIKIIS